MPLTNDNSAIIEPITIVNQPDPFTDLELLNKILNELTLIRVAMTFLASEGQRVNSVDLDPSTLDNINR